METEIPFHHYGEDGARYTVDVIRDRRDPDNPHYDVDLVRSLSGRFGESLEQRLTLAECPELEEASAQRDAIGSAIDDQGLAALGDAAERILKAPMLYDGQYLFVTYPPEAADLDRAAAHLLRLDASDLQLEPLAVGTAAEMKTAMEAWEHDWVHGALPSMVEPERHPIGNSGFTRDEAMNIHDNHGQAWTAHLDGSDTSHWFAIVAAAADASHSFELRYFRALETGDGTLRQDSYPVMPLADDYHGSAWPLPGLEMYLEKGDVFMAQQFAHDVADHYGQAFPNSLDLPALNPEAEYYFGYGVGPNNEPSLEKERYSLIFGRIFLPWLHPFSHR